MSKSYVPPCQAHDPNPENVGPVFLVILGLGLILVTLCIGIWQLLTWQLPELPKQEECYDEPHPFRQAMIPLVFIVGFGVIVCLFLRLFKMP